MAEENQQKLKSLLLRATEDAKLRKDFLTDPNKVARENGVTLTSEWTNKIARLGKFIDATAEYKFPPPKPGYPIDIVLRNWQMESVKNLISTFAPMEIPQGNPVALTPIQLPKPNPREVNALAGPMYTVNIGSAGWLYIYASGKIQFVPNAYIEQITRSLEKQAGQEISS